MKKLTDNQKAKIVRIVARYALYCVFIGAIAIILSGIFSTQYITVNWVKLLIGGALIYAVEYTCSWVFRKPTRKDTDKQ